ncbi:MAG: hypothetical protein QE487_17050 [Fluviicola sp.]|nr:hypothetical protein [Fluviicola sp.]
MKLLFLASVIALCSFHKLPATNCGERIFAWEQQTANDERFVDFPKVSGKKNGPKYVGGDKALDRLIREKLILSEEAQGHIFNLNYYFVVNCDGSIGDVVILGDEIVAEWTNIRNIIVHTMGWKPALFDKKPVNCIYFRTLMINGKDYKSK